MYDHNLDVVKALVSERKTIEVASLAELRGKLRAPRVVWVMVPADDIITSVIIDLVDTLESDDIVIDGGNSYYRDDIEYVKIFSEKGIHLLDCGISGGVWSRERGYCLTVGGDDCALRTQSHCSLPSRRVSKQHRVRRTDTVISRKLRRAICTMSLVGQAISSG